MSHPGKGGRPLAGVKQRIAAVRDLLDERPRRLVVASESMLYGRPVLEITDLGTAGKILQDRHHLGRRTQALLSRGGTPRDEDREG